jgi:hypothetical protein
VLGGSIEQATQDPLTTLYEVDAEGIRTHGTTPTPY